ncbi:MAG: SGNH/GDSL hydrolase family protein [Planctomycetes bacterium]|nr:SGNH/GDSL hydrolase family protein [Planctomycetota bacterium]
MSSPPPIPLPAPVRRGRAWKAAAALGTLLILAGLGEVSIRVMDRARGYPPFFHETLGKYPALQSDPLLRTRRRPHYRIDKSYIGGAQWSFNSRGNRGSQEYAVPKPAGVYRVLCIGGSTTASGNVSCDQATWTAQLQRGWNEHLPAWNAARHARSEPPVASIEVVNHGVVGWTTVQDLVYFVTEGIDLEPDVAICMEAINDIQAASLEGIDAGYRPWMLRDWFRPWEHRTRVDNLLGWSRLYWVLRNRVRDWNTPRDPTPLAWRTHSVHPRGPVHFRRNLENFVAAAHVHGIRPVLMTQPCTLLWDDPTLRMPDKHNPVFKPKGPALTPEAYVEAHRLYNDITREVARAGSAEMVDLADLTPQRSGTMDDTVHETDLGAEERAGLILDALAQ